MVRIFVLALGIAASSLVLAQSADAGDVDQVVAAIKAANPDLKALCQKGPDGIRKASGEAVMALMGQGKLKGNPQAAGGEAGQRIGRECRGG